MHCQACGNSLGPGLSYCPRCGSIQSLVRNADANQSPSISPDSLIWAVVVVTVTVLGLLLGGMVVLKNNGLGDDLVWTFVAVCFLALIGVDVMLLRMLQLLRRGVPEKSSIGNGGTTVKELTPRDTSEIQARMLGNSPLSVTEQTTRAFEPVNVRKSEQ